MSVIKDFSEVVYLEIPSELLAEQLNEVAKRLTEASEEYMARMEKELGDVSKAVNFFVSVGMGMEVRGDKALLADCFHRSVEGLKRSEHLQRIANNLTMLPGHIIRIKADQAKDFSF